MMTDSTNNIFAFTQMICNSDSAKSPTSIEINNLYNG